MLKIVLASDNLGKLKEINSFFSSMNIELISQAQFKLSSAPEIGLSFVENALIKARHAAKGSGLPALADDSGLAVEALGGAPGIYSARYAADKASSEENIQKLLHVMTDLPADARKARFYCAIAFVRHGEDPIPIICQNYWEGVILNHSQGDGGFGYDPIFFLPDQNCTAAQLDPAHKNQMSHRAKALTALTQELKLIYPHILR